MGTALQMKPILDAGRGRRRSQRAHPHQEQGRRAHPGAGGAGDGRPLAAVYLGILHAAAPEEAQQLEADLVSQLKPDETTMAEVGPVIATHTGPGVVGVAFYAE